MSHTPAARETLCFLLAADVTGAPHPSPDAALWPAIVRLADRERLLPALAAALRRRRVVHLPDGLGGFLDSVLSRARRRNESLCHQLAEAASILNGIGLQPVLLKGAIRLIDGLYVDPGARVLLDLDLLVSRDRLTEAQACMVAAGCREQLPDFPPPPDAHHAPPLLREGWPVPVELHRSLSVEPFAGVLPPEEMRARCVGADLADAQVLIPSREDQLLHLVLHALIHHAGHAKARFPLAHLFEGWLLLRAGGGDAGATSLTRLSLLGHHGPAAAWLARTAELFGEPALAPPRLYPAGRFLLARVRAQERWPWLERAGCLTGHFAHALHRAAGSPARRRRLMRGLIDPAFWTRRRVELLRLLHQP